MSLVNAAFTSNPATLESNVALANAELSGCSPAQIIAWALARAERPVISTNFRPGAAALLHMVTRVRADIPVVWIDTGYNTPATYRYVESLRQRWQLNLHCYAPRVTAARRAALGNDVPKPDGAAFLRFARETKLEPFERAFNELKPDVWFTGIRRGQSEFRENLGVISRGLRNTLRVAPLFDWSDTQTRAYLRSQAIEDNFDYVDPTKPETHLECGIQLLT